MERILAVLSLSLMLSAAVADDGIWVSQDKLTPADLTSSGAVLTESDSILGPDGSTTNMSYWLGGGDVVYRCAELRGSEAPQTSCWRWEPVVTQEILPEGAARSISSRRRPALPYYHDPFLTRSRLWVGVSGAR